MINYKNVFKPVILIGVFILCGCFTQNETFAIQSEIPVWGIFEVSFENSKIYDNPFTEVSLDVVYTNPKGKNISFWGFYDGNSTWRIRYMPDMIGTWKFSAIFSDGTPAGNGKFEVVSSGIPGPLDHDISNSTWFGYRGGKHAVIRSFHVGDRFFASNWPPEKREEFLDFAVAQGYNMFSVGSFFLNRNAEGRGEGWKTPDLWDGLNNVPVPEEYRKAEALLAELAEREIIVYPFAGFFGQSSDFPLNAFGKTLYIKYTLARFGAYWNLLLNLAGPEPLWRPDAFKHKLSLSEIIRLANEIKELDPYNHIISVHNETGTDPFRPELWHGYLNLQGGKGIVGDDVYKYIVKQQKHTSKPVYAQEVFWPGNMWHVFDWENYDEIRKKAYLLLFSGAAINYADMSGNSSSGFSGSLNLADKHQAYHDIMKNAWDWLESIPWYLMQPVEGMAKNGYVLAQNGVRYAVYTLNAKEGIELNLAGANGSFTLKWYNTRTNEYSSITKKIGGSKSVSLGLPPSEKEMDWIALLEKDDAKEFYTDKNGIISIEAENALAVNDWIQVKGISGFAMRDEGTRDDGYMEYPVVFDNPGRYYFYGLMRRTDTIRNDAANDAFVTLSGRKTYGSDDVTRPDGIRCSELTFTWQSMPKGPGAHTPRNIWMDPLYFEVPAAGRYTLKVGSRSKGFEIDKIILAPNKETPVNLGHPETVRKVKD